MYWNVWVSVAASRFSLYGGIAFFIYQGRDSFISGTLSGTDAVEGLNRLKSRVVFTFCFMEMMTWFWVCLYSFYFCIPQKEGEEVAEGSGYID